MSQDQGSMVDGRTEKMSQGQSSVENERPKKMSSNQGSVLEGGVKCLLNEA